MNAGQERYVQVSKFPLIINLEVFRGQCPCRCRHCPIGLVEPRARKLRFGFGGVDMELLRKVATEVAAYPPAILRVHSTGEPLLWENLPAALAIIREAGVSSWLFTSAVTSSDALLRDIARTMQVIEVSVNSINPEGYAVTKGVDAFDQVVRNIRLLRESINDRPGARLIVSRVQSENPEADLAFVEHWKGGGLVDDAFVRTLHTYNRLIDVPQSVSRDAAPAMHHVACLVHWARFNISLGGQAIVCFNELFKPEIDPKLVYGDINKQTIETIWRGEKMQAVRDAELSGDYHDPQVADTLPCWNCDRCQPLFGVDGVQTSECQLKQLRHAANSKAELC